MKKAWALVGSGPVDGRRLLAVVAFILPIVFAIEDKLTVVFMIGILIGALLLVRPMRPRYRPSVVAGFALLLVWAFLSALWSIDAPQSMLRDVRLILTAAPGILLCAIAASQNFVARKEVLRALALGFLIASVLTLVAGFDIPVPLDGGMATVRAGMSPLAFGSIAVIIVFGLAATLDERPASALVPLAIIVGAVMIVLRGNSASAMALVAGAIVFAAVFVFGRRAVILLAVAVPIFFVLSGVGIQKLDLPARAKELGVTLKSSAGHRLIIWRFAYNRILERPVLGWGLHASRLMPGREQVADEASGYADIFATTKFSPTAKIEQMPMHPHNATLQIWLELGVVGLLLYAALFGLCLRALDRTGLPRLATAAGAGGIVAVFLVGQLSFSVWQTWWLCSQFLGAALFLFVAPKPTHTEADASSRAGSG